MPHPGPARACEPDDGDVQLSPALDELAGREKVLALETRGRRHDVGSRYGMLEAQIAFSLAGVDRDQVLTSLLELMLLEQGHAGPGAEG